MTPSRPYLTRALFEWILDNDWTPYVLVDANIVGVQVPQEHVKAGQIVLNISPGAVRDLLIDNEAVQFSARFGGVPQSIYVPILAVEAIYAKENGQGMVFGHEAGAPDPNEPTPPPKPTGVKKDGDRPSGRPTLSIVK